MIPYYVIIVIDIKQHGTERLDILRISYLIKLFTVRPIIHYPGFIHKDFIINYMEKKNLEDRLGGFHDVGF